MPHAYIHRECLAHNARGQKCESSSVVADPANVNRNYGKDSWLEYESVKCKLFLATMQPEMKGN